MAAAHRGGCLYGPNLGRENTIHAFGEAVALGYNVLETDLRTTADGHVVVFHDPSLGRVTDGHGLIADLRLSSVKRARVGGIDEIPTLDEVLEEFPTQQFLFDLKDSRTTRPACETVRRHNAFDRVCFGSFKQCRLARLRRLGGREAITSAGPAEVGMNLFLPRLATLTRGPAAFQIPLVFTRPPIRIRVLTRSFLAAAHARGSAVHVWTVDTEAEMHEVLDMGVDGIVTDAIDVLRTVLIERGLWGTA